MISRCSKTRLGARPRHGVRRTPATTGRRTTLSTKMPITKSGLASGALFALAVALALALALGARQADADPVAVGSELGQAGAGSLAQPGGDYNTLDTFISDLFEDRLKKNKQHSVRQIKQTMRFGRRSDPLMLPALNLDRDEDETARPEHLPGRLGALYED